MIEQAKEVAQRLREDGPAVFSGTELAYYIDALCAEVERLTKVDVEPDKLDALTKVIAELEKALDCNEYIERRQYSEPHTMAATVRRHINKAMDLLVIEAAKAGFAKALNPDPASALAALRNATLEDAAVTCERFQDATDKLKWPSGYECAAAIREMKK